MKVKNKTITLMLIILISYLLINIELHAQMTRESYAWRLSVADYLRKAGVDTTDFARIKQIADSCDHRLNQDAMLFLAQHGVRDILPKLTECFFQSFKNAWWWQTYHYTAALMILEEESAHPYVSAFLDSMIVQQRELRGRYFAHDFAMTIDLLLDFDDYSQYELFKKLFSGYDRPHDADIQKFYRFAKDPSKEADAYETVKGLVSNPNPEYRYYAMWTLFWFQNHADRFNVFQQVALNDSSIKNRYYASNYLKSLEDHPGAIEGYEALIRSQVDTQYCGWAIMDLEEINSPYALSALLRLQKELQPGYLLNDLNLTIETYAPKKPASWENVTVSNMIDSLGPFAQQCASLGWLGDANFVKELDNHLTNAKKHFEKKDSIETAYEIGKFQSKINKEYKEGNIGDNRFVTIEGWKFLYYNAQYIIERLVTLPPRSNASLLDQITALRTQIRTDASQGLIGGKLLLKGLESSLDLAKQRLEKKDSVGTALYVTLFQQTVRLTYEITKKLPSSKLYVRAAGYISLYYRAGYILEGLLEPVGQPMPKMDSALEKELQKYEKEVNEQMSR
jgi:hypothetical protein